MLMMGHQHKAVAGEGYKGCSSCNIPHLCKSAYLLQDISPSFSEFFARDFGSLSRRAVHDQDYGTFSTFGIISCVTEIAGLVQQYVWGCSSDGPEQRV
jgi:hypothetical protein